MDEPSVLDFVRAKLTFWKHTELRIPDVNEPPIEWEDLHASGETVPSASAAPAGGLPEVQAAERSVRIPWLAFLPLGFALAAQLMLEPPNRSWGPAIALYLFAAMLTGLASMRNVLVPADARPEPLPGERPPDDLRYPWMVSIGGLTLAPIFLLVLFMFNSSFGIGETALVLLLIAAFAVVGYFGAVWIGQRLGKGEVKGQESRPWFVILALLLISFTILVMGGNRLNDLNLMAWGLSLLVSLGLVIRLDPKTAWQSLRTRFSQPLTLKIGLYAVLLLLVIAVIAYFRFDNLRGLPGEMFSDHAEKLLDVNDLLHGQHKIFFERNTGREMFQFYLTALMGIVFQTGISFMSLKIGTALAGVVTLFFIYRLGNEIGGKWVALYALFFAGIAYWSNIISRIGLRFPLYPFCVAPVLFYLLRGLRRENRNDFIWAGIWLGIGLHGYTATRIVPLVVIAAFALYLLHQQSKGKRSEALAWLVILAFVAFVVFAPLYRYALDNPQMVGYRSLTRLGTEERPLPGSPVAIFLSNTWNALVMFFWDNGDVWVHSIPHRPALALVDAALFFCGVVLLIARYLKRYHWRDLFLVISIPLLLLPSILSLAFPNENPNLNRTAGAYVPVFIIIAIAFDAVVRALRDKISGRAGMASAVVVGGFLIFSSLSSNADLFFNQYYNEYNLGAWNTAEMGQVMKGFSAMTGTADTTWIVGYPYWVDTRLVAIEAGHIERNPETSPDSLDQTFKDPRTKLYMLNTADTPSLDKLRAQFPNGRFWLDKSPYPGKDFIVFLAPAEADTMP